MAKSNYLPGILLLSFIGVYIGVGSNSLGRKYQVSGIKNLKKYQESSIKNQVLRSVSGNMIFQNLANPTFDTANSQTSDFRPQTSVTVLRNRVKTIYDSQLGVRETAPNRGPEVEKYLRYVNVSKGNPWCAAFVCWVLGEAGVVNPRSGWSPALFGGGRVIWGKGVSGIKPAWPVGRYQVLRFPQSVPSAYASSLATGNWTRARDKEQVATTTTVPGVCLSSPTTNNQQPTTSDVFGIFFPEKQRIAHVGFVDEMEGSWLITVEGNTNTSGGREGDGVYRKRRPVRSIYRVARYIN